MRVIFISIIIAQVLLICCPNRLFGSSAALRDKAQRDDVNDNNQPHRVHDVSFEISLDSCINTEPHLLIYENNFNTSPLQADRREILPSSRSGHKFVFRLPKQSKPMYFSLIYYLDLNPVFILDTYHFEPGDDIQIGVRKNVINRQFDVSFKGNNYAKYLCKYNLQKATLNFQKEIKLLPKNHYNDFEITAMYIKMQEAEVNKYLSQITVYSTNLLKIDIASKLLSNFLKAWKFRFDNAKSANDVVAQKQSLIEYEAFLNYPSHRYLAQNIHYASRYYAPFILQKIQMDFYVNNREFKSNNGLSAIVRISNTSLRDKIITLFIDKIKTLDMFEDVFTQALKIVKKEDCLNKLLQFKQVTVGHKAFDFALENEKGDTINLDDFKGKTLFIDFWFTGCGACQNYYLDVVTDVEEIFKDDPNIVFITICTDKEKAKWLGSLTAGKNTSNKAINLYTNGEGNAHEIIKFYNITGYPRPMIIDRKGQLFNIKNSDLRNKEGLIRELKEAKKAS